jgi:hypothetical protein
LEKIKDFTQNLKIFNNVDISHENADLYGVVAHTCNPSYLGGRDRRIIVQA